MFSLDGLWLIGVVLVVLSFSARAVYEELDQDLPYVVWPTIMLQYIGYFLMVWPLWRRGAPVWMLAASIALLFTHTIVDTFNFMESFYLVKLLLVFGVMGLAASVILPSNMNFGGILVVLLGAATVLITETVILPAESDRRLASAPGMSLWILGWIMLGLYLTPSGAGFSTIPPVPAVPVPLGPPMASPTSFRL